MSLREIFECRELLELAGSACDRFIAFIFLRALTQRALEPQLDSEEDWAELDDDAVRSAVLDYLERHAEAFDLYGEKPFLQYPAITSEKAWNVEELRFGVPASTNASLLYNDQRRRSLDDSELVYGFLRLVLLPFGGKRPDKKVVLLKGYDKPGSAAAALLLGRAGYLHSFGLGDGLIATLRINLMTMEALEDLPYIHGMGVPPWEKMPVHEKDFGASLYEFLVPVARFVRLDGDKVHVTEGVRPELVSGQVPPSVSVMVARPKEEKASEIKKNKKVASKLKKASGGQEVKSLWAKTSVLPWRSLEQVLPYFNPASGWKCPQTALSARRKGWRGVWSVGLQVSSNSGEQFLSGTDDTVSGIFALPEGAAGEVAFSRYREEMERLTHDAKCLYAAVAGYGEDVGLSGETARALGQETVAKFWRDCGEWVEDLEDLCRTGEREAYRRKTRGAVLREYSASCPMETARQLAAWAKHSPRFKKEEKE